ncbi:MAG: hypothetical protein DRO67_02025 [Candidatus Asgardarchaeum californiense]|nr:MAG: hypothetical protein DRO67_02025 [Candidatus Asgardarchaeum californiense]
MAMLPEFMNIHIEQHLLDSFRYQITPMLIDIKKYREEEVDKVDNNGSTLTELCVTELCSTEIPRNWEFEVPHPNIICIDEIDKYVTRTNPLVFIQREGKCICLIHRSIVAKDNLLYKELIGLEPLSNNNNVYTGSIEPDKIKEVTETVRKIKRAEWGSVAKRQKVRVIVPKI